MLSRQETVTALLYFPVRILWVLCEWIVCSLHLANTVLSVVRPCRLVVDVAYSPVQRRDRRAQEQRAKQKIQGICKEEIQDSSKKAFLNGLL